VQNFGSVILIQQKHFCSMEKKEEKKLTKLEKILEKEKKSGILPAT
jgi:hypothetical protein